MKNTRSAIFKRQNLILQKLNSNGSIFIEEIARELHVSPLTVRRDIDEFVQKGLAQRFSAGHRLSIVRYVPILPVPTSIH